MRSPSLSSESEEFLSIKTREELANWIGWSDRKLRHLLYKLSPADKYRSFAIKKRNGSDRQIDAPKEYLKRIQRRICLILQEVAPPTGIAKGFVKENSIADHARLHRNRKWVIVADLANFFPSINFGRVLGAFMSAPLGFPKPVAICLAQLCCYNGALPQGAPTSPALSNLICRSLDRELVRLAKSCRASVTRYGDDICFSTNETHLPDKLAETARDGSYVPSHYLTDATAKNGFQLNLRKFRVRTSQQSQMVTGLIVNKRVGMPRAWKRQFRTLLHLMNKYGDAVGLGIVSRWNHRGLRNRRAQSLANVIRGKANFAKWLDDLSGTRFVESLYRGYRKQRSLLPRIGPGIDFRIMTEGDSDALHLRAALERFQQQGMFDELRPRFENYAGDKGDIDLMETLKRLAKVNVHEIVVGIFDRDNASFMRSHVATPGGHVRLGPMVFALFLAPPNSSMSRFCIESLYERTEATLYTADDRRIFFSDEFDPTTGLDLTSKYKRTHPSKTAVVLSDQVLRLKDGKSVLLPKMDFAKMIAANIEPFSNLNIEGFKPTFLAIRDVLSVIVGS